MRLVKKRPPSFSFHFSYNLIEDFRRRDINIALYLIIDAIGSLMYRTRFSNEFSMMCIRIKLWPNITGTLHEINSYHVVGNICAGGILCSSAIILMNFEAFAMSVLPYHKKSITAAAKVCCKNATNT